MNQGYNNFDGAIVGTYLAGGIGGLHALSIFVGEKLNAKDLALSKELSQRQVQLLLDCLIDDKMLLQKYVGSTWSAEFWTNISGLHSGKTHGSLEKKQSKLHTTIPKEHKVEFENWRVNEYKKLPGVTQEYKFMKSYKDSKVQEAKDYRYKSELINKAIADSEPDTIRNKQLSSYLRNNKDKKEEFEKRFLDKLNQKVLSEGDKKYEEEFLTKHYSADDEKHLLKLKQKLQTLFTDHLLEDLTKDLGNMGVKFTNKDMEEFSQSGTVGHEYRIDGTRNFVRDALKNQGNGLKISPQDLPDTFLNVIGELAFCRHYQNELQKQYPRYKINVFKPGIIDDIASGIDAVVQFTPLDHTKEPLYIKIDIKTTNSKKYISQSLENNGIKQKPAWNLSQYEALMNGQTKATSIITNAHEVVSVHPSVIFYEIAQLLGPDLADSKKDSYYAYIHNLSSEGINKDDMIIKTMTGTASLIGTQIGNAFKDIK